MRGRNTSVAAGALATAALLAASSAEAACRLHKYFDLPVTMEGRAAVVSTKINGQEARFEVDTGDFYSMVTPEAAKRFKLESIPITNLRVVGFGGVGDVEGGEAKTFDFAGVPMKHVQFIVGGRQFHPGTVGLLGENLLSWADVEYDFANGVMKFLKPDGCNGADLVYWSNGPDDVIPIEAYEPLRQSNIVGRVKINGHWVRAVFDTGANTTLLSRRAAERAGVNMSGPDVKASGISGGFGRGVMETWTAPIDSFAIGSEEIKNTRLTIAKTDYLDADMFLGMDFFLSHHVLVSRSQNKLYFTYNGGPVFRTDQPPAAVSAPTPAAAAGDAPKTDAAPATADELSRRGDALMSRREFAAALEAFDKAVELEPKEPRRYLERARARLALGRRTLAMADLDRALELKPDFSEALVARGELFLRDGDLARAGADFDAAIKAAPNESDLRLRIAAAYMRNSRYELAIAQYDAWIVDHPHDERLWTGLNGRCWARAMMGKALDKALEDCNAALRKGVRNSEVLDSRGLVHLRLGQYREAIEDYDAALKLQPKGAWSLYGRGLAKQRLGDAAGGAADIAAAVAINPALPAQAKRIGLVDGKAEPVTYSGPAPATPAAAPAPAKPQ